MADIAAGINLAGSSNYSIDQILQATRPPASGGGFRRVLGGLLGSVGNMFAPGVGGMIGSIISGGLGGSAFGGTGGLLQDSMQYLQLQRQMNAETEAFQTASTVMKCRHDSAMAAVHNMSG